MINLEIILSKVTDSEDNATCLYADLTYKGVSVDLSWNQRGVQEKKGGDERGG